MFAVRRLAVVLAAAIPMIVLTLGVPSPSGAVKSVAPAASSAMSAAASMPRYSWTPGQRVIFNTPDTDQKRAILAHIIQSVRSTRPGRVIRMAMWNFDDKPARIELIDAHKRGVAVQILVSAQVDNPNFTALRNALNRKSPNAAKQPTASWARKCNAGCRTPRGRGIMHTKFFLFNNVGSARNISMFGSVNLTTAAGNRQWNDLTSVNNNRRLYEAFLALFKELRRDRPVQPPYKVWNVGRTYRVAAFPLNTQDTGGPVLRDMKKVSCRGTAKGYGVNGRTKIRIAIAGWFDEYGARIARQVRRLWNRGCDVKIINTLTGRGINKALRDPSGRGPVPNREVTRDRNGDGIPERYLHLKYWTVDGIYDGDRSSRVYFTGSANWSARATRSDEIYVRVKKGRWTKRYANHVDRLFSGPYAHSPFARTSTARTLPGADVSTDVMTPQEIYDPANEHLVPDWFETD